MGSFPFLEWLARDYKQRAECSGKWTDYVKAHGLANFCVVKDSTEDRKKLVYNIEESWYKGGHPLSYDEHQQLIIQHKSVIKSYRDVTRDDYKQLEAQAKNFDIREIYSEENLNNAASFSHQVFSASEKCSKGLVGVSERIISSSVDVLQRIDLTAPCKFAVIGLGSIAKGEATPYSDLEYAFIVEQDEEYFEKLAVDSYFRISNLGETPLKYFDIEELKVLKGSLPIIADNIAAGYRIDGLMEKAGNIPTGNGRDGSKMLTLTVDAFIELYKSSAEAPFNAKQPGDLSDILASSVVIYTNEGQASQLYVEFVQARMAYELSNEHTISIDRKRLASLAGDMNEYKFLPEFIRFQPPNNTNIQIKTEIFRYPTLLANYIKMLLRLNSQYSWESFSHLHKEGMLCNENYRYINTVLALSIYMRTSAYISYGSQTESMSLIPTINSSAKSKYSVPGAIFVLYGCLLTFIKKSVTLFVKQDAAETISMGDTVTSLFANIKTCKTNFWEKAEVCYFAGQYHLAKKELEKALDTSVDSASCDKLLQTLVHSFDEHKSVTKYVELCCYILYYTGSYATADSYFQWLLSNGQSREDVGLLMLLAAHCKKELNDYQTSGQLATKAKSHLNQIDGELYTTDCNHGDATVSYNNIGIVYCTLGEYREALAYYTKALRMCFLMYGATTNHPDIASCYCSIGNAYYGLGDNTLAMEYHTKSLDMRKAIYGATTNHPYIATSYNNIGNAYHSVGNYTLAIEHHTKSLNMWKAICGAATNHTHIAASYNGIANAYNILGNYTLAIEYHTKALYMRKAIYGAKTKNPDIANSYNNIGRTYNRLGIYNLAIEYYTKSLDMSKAIYGATTKHPDIAKSYHSIGEAYNGLGNSALAMEYHTKSLDLRKAIYGATTNHSNIATSYSNIGITYNILGNNILAIEYYTKSLDMSKAIYGATTIHPDIAKSYNHIGNAYNGLGNYILAIEYYTKSLDMWKAIYGANTNHPDIARNYLTIGVAYGELGNYTLAIEYYTKSLDMQKAIYGATTNHPDIANSYNTIGNAYNRLGNYTLAIDYYTKSLDMSKAIYGATANHPDIANSYNNIGVAYGELGNYILAIEYYIKSLNMWKAIYGANTNHPDIARNYLNIGVAYGALRNYTLAIEYYTKSLNMWKAIYGASTNHPDIARNYLNIGVAYGALGNYTLAIEYYTKSLDMWKAIYGASTNHPYIATSYSNVGNAYYNQRNYPLAIEYLTKSLNMRKAVYGDSTNHPDIANSYNNIGDAYHDQGNYTIAIEYLTKSLNMRKAIYGESTNHPDIANN